MLRFAFFPAICLVAISAAQAGQIDMIGQVSGGQNYGLTSAYINGGNTKATLNVYNSLLFNSAANSSTPITQPTATSSTPLTVSDANGVNFAMIGDPTSNNAWYSTNVAGLSNIVVPINVLDVDTVYTMLNDVAASAVSVAFYFNSTDTTAGATIVTVNLADNADIRNGILCSINCGATHSTSLNATNSGVTATGDPSGPITVSTSSINYPNSAGATNTTWNPAYTSLGAGQDAGSTAGTLTLDDQAFQFGNTFTTGVDAVNNILVQMVVTEGALTNGHFNLTAVSVDSTAVTPEPGTLSLAGFAGIVFAGAAWTRRRRRTA